MTSYGMRCSWARLFGFVQKNNPEMIHSEVQFFFSKNWQKSFLPYSCWVRNYCWLVDEGKSFLWSGKNHRVYVVYVIGHNVLSKLQYLLHNESNIPQPRILVFLNHRARHSRSSVRKSHNSAFPSLSPRDLRSRPHDGAVTRLYQLL